MSMTDMNTEVQEKLRDFVVGHPDGWNHQDWIGLLGDLESAGVDAGQSEDIGLMLEQERLTIFLSGTGVKGLGPKRREAVVSRFGRLWDLEHATVDEVAAVPGVSRSLAESLVQALA